MVMSGGMAEFGARPAGERTVTSLFAGARACLDARDPDAKLALTRDTAQAWRRGLQQPVDSLAPEPIAVPGRPERPELVQPSRVVARKLSSEAGRAALLHALAHIEFNAINLAWDAVYRFRGLPPAYYGDWVRVAGEEARHFGLLRERLRSLGHDYGDFPAHDGLWEMACRTGHDVLVRMALVPRVLEARGLDVTPGMIARLQGAGDVDSARVLEIIFRDEIGHVEIGSRWFRYICRQRELDPLHTFRELLDEYMHGRVKDPLNDAARQQAGFDSDELELLHRITREGK
jgi:uncharacterized ferritin-like protein (DUF455 family)